MHPDRPYAVVPDAAVTEALRIYVPCEEGGGVFYAPVLCERLSDESYRILVDRFFEPEDDLQLYKFGPGDTASGEMATLNPGEVPQLVAQGLIRSGSADNDAKRMLFVILEENPEPSSLLRVFGQTAVRGLLTKMDRKDAVDVSRRPRVRQQTSRGSRGSGLTMNLLRLLLRLFFRLFRPRELAAFESTVNRVRERSGADPPVDKPTVIGALRAIAERRPSTSEELGELEAESVVLGERIRTSGICDDVPHFVWHFLSDADVRFKDEKYRDWQLGKLEACISAWDSRTAGEPGD